MQGPAVYVPSKDQLAYNLQIHLLGTDNTKLSKAKY